MASSSAFSTMAAPRTKLLAAMHVELRHREQGNSSDDHQDVKH